MERVTQDAKSKVVAFHFLYGDCPCSRRVLKHVAGRGKIAGATEHIVLIGNDDPLGREAQAKGFGIDIVSPEDLKSVYGIESAPLLVVTDCSGTILYSGGYTPRKQGLAIKDVAIIGQAVAGDVPKGLPLYGCAVSKDLKAIIDPLSIK